MKQNLLLLSIVTVCLLLLVEGGLRMYQSTVRNRSIDDMRFHPIYRDYFFYGINFKPGSGGSWQAVPEMQINSLGFRGPEVSIEKPPGRYRILTIGASTSHSGEYPRRLERILRERTERELEIINAAVPSWNTTQSLIQYLTRGQYLEPDLVIVYHAINDSFMLDKQWLEEMREVDYRKYGGFLAQHSVLYNFLANRFARLRLKLEERGLIPITSIELPDLNLPYGEEIFRTNLETIIASAKARGADVMLVTMALDYHDGLSQEEAATRAGFAYQFHDFYVKRVQRLNQTIREVGIAKGIKVVDAAQSNIAGVDENFSDICHFSDEGAERFAELLADEVTSLVNRGEFSASDQ